MRFRRATPAVALLAAGVGVALHVGLDGVDGGAPPDVLANSAVIESTLLIPSPDEWGGTYVDGDVLVVNTVTRSVPEATAVLRGLGVRQGIEVRQVESSIAELESISDAVLAEDSLGDAVASVGPDYSRSRVVVGIRTGADPSTVSAGLDEVRAALAAAGSPAADVPIVTDDGGFPALFAAAG